MILRGPLPPWRRECDDGASDLLDNWLISHLWAATFFKPFLPLPISPHTDLVWLSFFLFIVCLSTHGGRDHLVRCPSMRLASPYQSAQTDTGANDIGIQ